MELFLLLVLLLALAMLAFALWRNRILAARVMRMERARREQESELAQQAALLAALNHVATDGLIVLNKYGRVISLNEVARSFLLLARGMGEPMNEIVWGPDLQSLIDQVLNQRADSLEQIVTRGERAFAVRVQAVSGAGDTRVLLRLDEVTELQRLGRARREFVANISHELRTPVTSLQLLVETMNDETLNDRTFLARLLDKMHLQIGLLRQLTDELMELALIESGQAPLKLMETDAADLIHHAADALRPQADRKNIRLDVMVAPEIRVLADAQGIRKVLGNLIHNAIKFTNTGGHIKVEAVRQNDDVQFSISDTGIGIPARDLPRVFERFYKVDRARTREAGERRSTGLGLAIAKHTIEAHGGKIWAESIEGKGSVFFFTLPAA